MQQLGNFGSTTVNHDFLSTDTAAIVTDGSVFPGSGNFIVWINKTEYAVVNAISGTNITFSARGYAGTTAVDHFVGETIELVLTKEALESYFGERIQVGGYASRPSSPHAGTLYFANDINLAWYYDGGNWNLYHPVYVPYTNRVDISSWTGVNLSTSTWTDTNGVLTIGAIPVAGADALRLYYHTKPTAPFKLNCIVQAGNITGQFSGAGIGFYDSSGGKIQTLMNFNNGTLQSCSVDKYNSTSSFNSNAVRFQHWGSPIWFQIEDDNTHWTWRMSFDGVNYLQLYQETRNSFFTPDKVCIVMDRTENTWSDNEYYQFLGYWEN